MSRVVAAIVLSLSLLACGAAVPKAAALPGAAGAPASAPPNRASFETRVLFATDRERTSASESDYAHWFGAESSPQLSFGSCLVSIPRDHAAGVLETHAWWKLQFADEPGRDVTLMRIEPMVRSAFVADLRDKVATSPQKRALVFIHGFNTTFSDAVRRTAQLAFDLNFDGVPLAYSWPSRGTLTGYKDDAKAADATAAHLHDFLSLVSSESGATEVSLIVHSMGNRALAGALVDLARHPSVGTVTVREVVLAAADLDRQTFETQIAPEFAAMHARVTLYASGRDEALLVSEIVNGPPRVGEIRDGIVVVPGVESVDASAVDGSLVGHSYFAESASVLGDIYGVVMRHLAPSERDRLAPVGSPPSEFWRFVVPPQ